MAVQTYPAKQIARQVRLKALIYGPAGCWQDAPHHDAAKARPGVGL
jgi:hypothetical protein